MEPTPPPPAAPSAPRESRSRLVPGAGRLTAQDVARVAAALEAELAPTTRTAYASAWRQWERWCHTRDMVPIPAAPEAICAYLTERAEAGLGYGSVEMALAAIGERHRRAGLDDPTHDPTLKRVRRGLRRLLGAAPQHHAHPLTLTELTKILTAIDPATPIGVRDRALLLFGFASALRPSELAALDTRDIIERPDDGFLVVIRRSKTDPDARGQLVGVATGNHHSTDPVAALRAWNHTRSPGPGPLFTQIDRSGAATRNPITGVTVSRLVRRRAITAGMAEFGISGHSLRAGDATTAAQNGAPVDRIAAQTRHRALDSLIAHYIRPADTMARTTSRDLGL